MHALDDDRRSRLLTAFATLDYCTSLSNATLAELLFDTIVVDLPVLSPEFALLSTIVDRLRGHQDGTPLPLTHEPCCVSLQGLGLPCNCLASKEI